MASSTQTTPYTAPPPTPSTHSTTPNPTFSDTALSNLFHRLQPTLTLPTRRLSRLSTTPTTIPPFINLSDTPTTPSLLSTATELGFFHHPAPHLPVVAASGLFNLPHETKLSLFPNTNTKWPLGYDNEEGEGESFCIDLFNELLTIKSKSDLDLRCLGEFGSQMEKLGLEVIEELGRVAGFENPGKNDPNKICSMIWVCDGLEKPGRVYPYVVGLHFQVDRKYSLLTDSGWIDVLGRADSVLVTLGDIAQVWSNGKFKKVRGIPMPSMDDDDKTNSSCITLSLLITLPLESTVSPLIPDLPVEEQEDHKDFGKEDSVKKTGEQSMFCSFSFEDYAWKVYHERLFVKDPLVRYRF